LMGLVFGRYDSKRFKFQSFIGYIWLRQYMIIMFPLQTADQPQQ
jgi:hypothetical protein